MARPRRMPAGTKRDYPRAARVNELLRQVLADEIERLEERHEGVGLVTVTGVDADREFRTARVYVDHLDDAIRRMLEAERPRLQRAIASQVRLRHTPQLRFEADPAIAAGERVESILRDLGDDDDVG